MIEGILVDAVITRINKQENIISALEEELVILKLVKLNPIKEKEHAFLHYELQQLFADYIIARIELQSPQSLTLTEIVYDTTNIIIINNNNNSNGNDNNCPLEELIDCELRYFEIEIANKIDFQLTKTIALEKGYKQLYTKIAQKCNILVELIIENVSKKSSQQLFYNNDLLTSVEDIINAYKNIQIRTESFLNYKINPQIISYKNGKYKKEGTITKIVFETALIGYFAYLIDAIETERNKELNKTKNDYHTIVVGLYGKLFDKIIELKDNNHIDKKIKATVDQKTDWLISSLISIQLSYFNFFSAEYHKSTMNNSDIFKTEEISSLIEMKKNIAGFTNKYKNYLKDINETSIENKCNQIMQEHGIYYH